MAVDPEILRRIPHRPPFLWVERIIAHDETSITTGTVFAAELDLFRGHYPNAPIVPGVILCEAIFQSGALLMSFVLPPSETEKVPVLTRIGGARFKRLVGPGDQVEITVKLQETMAGVWIMKGVAKVGGKTAVQVEFNCALTSS